MARGGPRGLVMHVKPIFKGKADLVLPAHFPNTAPCPFDEGGRRKGGKGRKREREEKVEGGRMV